MHISRHPRDKVVVVVDKGRDFTRGNLRALLYRYGASRRVVASVTKEILRNESDLCRAFRVIAHVLSTSRGQGTDISPRWIATFNADKLHRRASSSIGGVSPAPRPARPVRRGQNAWRFAALIAAH